MIKIMQYLLDLDYQIVKFVIPRCISNLVPTSILLSILIIISYPCIIVCVIENNHEIKLLSDT